MEMKNETRSDEVRRGRTLSPRQGAAPTVGDHVLVKQYEGPMDNTELKSSEDTKLPATGSEEGKENAAQPFPVIAVRDLTKTYILGGKTRVPALQGVSLDIHAGEFVAIMGPSGSGKSTFMNLIGCLDSPTSGGYWLVGNPVSNPSGDKLASIRSRLIGFVFQGFNLLGRETALKNVTLPMVYAGLSRREREIRARKVLQVVGLADRTGHKPSELSGGQQQRVAIARSLINGPVLL